MTGRGASLWFLVAAPLVASISGCFWFTSRAQGDELRVRSDELTKRVTTLEKQLESDREEYTTLIQKAEHDVNELEEVLQTATKSTGAYATDMENMREQLARLEGGLAELRQELSRGIDQRQAELRDRLELVASKVGLDPPLDPTKIPRDPTELLAAADDAAKAREYGNARSLYRNFIERFPTNSLADDAQLKVGRTYASENRHPQALAALNVVVDRYPDSDVMGETLYSMAESLFNMRSCNDAITLLQAVIQRYSEAGLNTRARNKLRDVQRAKRRGCQP